MQFEPYTPTDRFEELDRITLDAVFDVLGVYCRVFLPDLEASLVFLSRILRDPAAAKHPLTAVWLSRLVRRAAAHGPLDLQALDLAHRLTGDPVLGERLRRLGRFDDAAATADLRGVMNDPESLERRRRKLQLYLERTPGHVPAASALLRLDFFQGVEDGPWLDRFTVPAIFRDAWVRRRFLHLAGLGAADRALALWKELDGRSVCEVECNLAAAQYALLGDRENAALLYRRSLSLDPDQIPARLRLAELEHPSIPDPTLPEKRDTAICLYSWNKADDLEATLRGLSKTDIGRAKIRILLNGCTDRSPAVAEAARTFFPDNDFDVVTLPVNVGAPAARNWLGALPEVRASQYLAYLDDDVTLPRDWLTHYLTIMERFPATSAVGCKVVFSHDPRRIQYLHRRFSLAEPGLIKLTDPCQLNQMDCGMYDYVCPTETVMGCCHLLRTAHLPDGPGFDLRYSPSQVDDIAHDLDLRLAGGEVRYCGLVRCIHHQNSGSLFGQRLSSAQLGQLLGNDTKFYFVFRERIDDIRRLMREAAAD